MSYTRAISNIVVFSKIAQNFSRRQPISRCISQTACLQARIIEVVPALGESITEGSIASWNKSEGDSVAVDDVIVIVETDKVTVDIKSTNAGIFIAKLAEENVSLILLPVCPEVLSLISKRLIVSG
jgi:Biotin-requiring enzyme